MLSPNDKLFVFDLPGHYRILVLGQLGASLASRLGDVTITEQRQADRQLVTIVLGEMRDQAALMGMLNALYDAGCTLLKVERLGGLTRRDG